MNSATNTNNINNAKEAKAEVYRILDISVERNGRKGEQSYHTYLVMSIKRKHIFIVIFFLLSLSFRIRDYIYSLSLP